MKFEKTLNFIVGIFLLTNLYFLNNLIGISRDLIIVSLLLISLIFFIKNFSYELVRLLGFKLVLSYVLLSLILYVINAVLFDYNIYINDMIRIIGFMFFFGWTFSLYKSDSDGFYIFIKRLCEAIFIIVVLLAFFEYYFYFLFWSLIYGEPIDWEGDIRLAGTFMDSNTYAGALSVYLFLYLRLKGFGLKGWIYLIVFVFLINLSGSRLGFILVLVLIFPFLRKIKFNIILVKKIIFLVSFVCIILLIYINLYKVESNDTYKSVSTFDRIFDIEKKEKSDASSNERLASINDALSASNISNLILPPGNLYFRSKWEKEVKAEHFPHSAFLYLLVEYGIYILWPLFILLRVFRKSKRCNITTLFYLLFFQLLLLPNVVYYPTIFLIIFYIETNHEYSSNFAISKK